MSGATPPTDPRLRRLYESAKRLAIAKRRKDALTRAAAGLKTIAEAMADYRAKNTPPTDLPKT